MNDPEGQAAAWLAQRLGFRTEGADSAVSDGRTVPAAAAPAAPAGPGTHFPGHGSSFDYRKTGSRLYELAFEYRRQNRVSYWIT